MKIRPLLLHIAISSLVLFVLFNQTIQNLNHVYFSRSGDGFRTYYGIFFHARYDTTPYRIDAMNYPYGEIIGFTDCQPPVSNVIRFISNNITDITEYTTGIVNGLMLLSVLLASIILFLILRRMKLPVWYASFVALGITLLSPQLMRLGGHFSLGWLLWVPLSIYLLMVFDSKRAYYISILVCLFATLSGDMHFYFLAFWAFLFGLYWVYRWIWHSDYPFRKSDLLHFAIQVLLPVLILQLNLIINDPVSDRTANPWGFYTFRGHFATVFLPLYKSYIPFSGKLAFGVNYQWEAMCFIGLVASVGFFYLCTKWIIRCRKARKMVSLTGNKLYDFLLGSSVIVLLFSFGLPFILGLDGLRKLTGPLGQLRGVARFGWLFYYVVNIIVFRSLYISYIEKKKKNLAIKLFFVGVLALLAFEAWQNAGKYQHQLNNRIAELDPNDKTFADFCKMTVNPDEYQAIIPLPYFHIGSESIWIEQECDLMKKSFIVSMETGLPNTGMMAARSSISQTYQQIALTRIPWKHYEILDKYKNNKALLLTVGKCDKLSTDEKRLIGQAEYLGESHDLQLYKLPFDSLKALPEKVNFAPRYQAMIDSIASSHDSLTGQPHLDKTGRDKPKEITVSRHFQNIMEGSIKADPAKKCYLRFWVKNYAHDLVARSQLLVVQSGPQHETLEEIYTDIFRNFKTFDGEWALIEIPFTPKQENEIIKLLVKNYDLKGKILQFNEFSVSQTALE